MANDFDDDHRVKFIILICEIFNIKQVLTIKITRPFVNLIVNLHKNVMITTNDLTIFSFKYKI